MARRSSASSDRNGERPQLAVLEQLAAGRSYVQVAQALGLFPGMVESEIDNMRRKFGARSTHNLITMALTRGIAA